MGSTSRHRVVDDVLLDIVSGRPRFSFTGDLERFRLDFDRYKDEALGFPRDEHDELVSSSRVGELLEGHRRKRDRVEISDLSVPVIGDVLPGLHVRPIHGHPKRAVIVVPGHPSTASGGDPLKDLIDAASYQKGIALRLARDGFDVFAPGLRGFNTSGLTSPEWQGIVGMKSLSWYGFLTSDALLLRENIKEVYGYQPEDIAVMGLSTGGAVSMFASALSNDIPLAVVCGFFGSFAHNFVVETHSLSGNIPGVLRYFDQKDFMVRIAPRRVVVINGSEETFSADVAQREFEVVKEVFTDLGFAERAEILIPEGIGHEYDVDLILKILNDWASGIVEGNRGTT